jgi:hypothetical protein
MTCESLFSLELVFLKILLVVGGQREFVKEPKEGNNSSLCSLRERERERSEEGKKEREKGKTTELENTHRERECSPRERERERERRRERILISQSRRRIDWSRPLLSGFYILSQQHQRSA